MEEFMPGNAYVLLSVAKCASRDDIVAASSLSVEGVENSCILRIGLV